MHSNLTKYVVLACANVLFAQALYALISGPVGQNPALLYSLLFAGVAGCVYGLYLVSPVAGFVNAFVNAHPRVHAGASGLAG